MDIKQLTYFVEIAKEKSFTKAAANCYISQPALSKSIRQLEEELNTKLFIRDYPTFELTQEGEILLADAIDIIDTFNNIKARIKMIRTKVEHPIKFAVSPLCGNACFGNIIAKFCELNPGIPIDYYETDRIASQSFMKEMDISIVLLPQKITELSKDHLVTDIASCNLVGLVSGQYESEKMKKLSLKSFLEETVVTSEDVLHIIYANELNLIGKKHIFSSYNADYVQKMILQKEGFIVLPDFIARSMAADPLYRLVPLEYDILCRLVLVTKRNARYSQVMERIQNYILSEFALKYKST
ncbi:LysR family transcriptional regulator [Papillibacter cinnamivorans]|uniref:DNA-binding transcriptional regulator, LysR family n=1 Tax=Papillibacter cinnamivorans DSM 12816 TaxID=1122930 RepID=A0A1W1ZKM7_9FIRM|nr:LysR family transcriptional regulator [Papillibacter cinnamivorans]SMC48956.1 DNA-binding transcriptional regulator, LysR family [Papillibacter cinnamivorans DSM 12816]